MEYKKHPLVMLPTKDIPIKGSIISWNKDGTALSVAGHNNKTDVFFAFHLYILSDEEIKEGDWVVDATNQIRKVLNIIDKRLSLKGIDFLTILPQSCKKIIASTDQSLELPRPSDSFIKKYCELGGIDEVLVEYEYQCDLPKSALLKQAQEKFLKPKTSPDNTITIKLITTEEHFRNFIRANHLTEKWEAWIKQNL